MRAKSSKRYKRYLLIVLVLLSLGALVSDVSQTLGQSPLGRSLLRLFSPLIKSADFLEGIAEKAGAAFFRGRSLQKENETLREEIARMLLESAKRERELLDLQKAGSLSASQPLSGDQSYGFLRSHIIGYSPNPWSKTVLIDKGRLHGVRKEQTVLNEAGIVGVVQEVSPGTSRVHLVIDQRSALTIRVKETGELGVVYGTGEADRLILNTEGLSRRLRGNDHAVTAGLQNSLFPGNLLVGVVENIERDKFGRTTAILKPGVDFNRLDVVFILLGSEIQKGKTIEDNP